MARRCTTCARTSWLDSCWQPAYMRGACSTLKLYLSCTNIRREWILFCATYRKKYKRYEAVKIESSKSPLYSPPHICRTKLVLWIFFSEFVFRAHPAGRSRGVDSRDTESDVPCCNRSHGCTRRIRASISTMLSAFSACLSLSRTGYVIAYFSIILATTMPDDSR